MNIQNLARLQTRMINPEDALKIGLRMGGQLVGAQAPRPQLPAPALTRR